ncbi:MBL fold metallo-hydrolase [Metabacillus endolithicus]|uniref:MBL fold metallo-hydrolase n=1 Tax=Metabacillus endolithicus TaxID=1535204 RepID=A0ABW5C0M2_9BACI|nr:MBL fold metallo-hydrolase [Metabacillus endolithicus]UPG62430.1 MBL fold metallo-hydrolase [Metabacillus endolithicus]
MNFIQLNNSCYYFQGAVNIGYVRNGENGLLIDAGIDKQTMKKVLKRLQGDNLPVTHLFVTHAHSDHYGGAEHLQSTVDVYTYAPKLEAAMLRHPIIEPLYLFQGNKPLPEMRNKFLEGKPIRVDEEIEQATYPFGDIFFQCYSLPGHSINQHGLLIDKILYAADGYFAEEQLHKHKIPFIIDAKDTLESLHKLKSIDCVGAVPGHGLFEEDFVKTVDANISYHLKLMNSIKSVIQEHEAGIYHDELVAEICTKWDVGDLNVPSWMLFRTAVTAYVTMLVQENTTELLINNYRLMIRENKKSSH